jgi:hypothetical protein
VADSLAVLIALALEPEEQRPPPPAPPARPAPRVPAEHPSSADRPGFFDPMPPGWRLGVSGAGVVGGFGSPAGVGLAAYVEVARDVPEGFAPALRVGAELAGWQDPVTSPTPWSEVVDLSRRVLRVDACPLRAVARQAWSPSPVELWGCARFDTGVLGVSESGGPPAQRPWVAVGPDARVRWVTGHFFVDLDVGVAFPLLRETFLLAPGFVGYHVPTVAGAGAFGVGVFVL